MATAFDRVGMSTTTTGTGTLTLAAALGNVAPNLASFISFATAGVANGQSIPYLILDSNNNWEVGVGTYSSSGTTLTRNVLWSPNANAAINLSGNAQVFITEIAEDINQATFGGDRNKFGNPGMDVAQAGSSGTVSAGTTAYTLDFWQLSVTGASAAWSQAYNGNMAGNALRINCASGLTASTLQQRIESYTASQLLAKDKTAQLITIQFAIYNNSGGSITPKLATGQASAQDNFTTVNGDLGATNLQTIANGSLGVVAYTFVPAAVANGYQIQLQFGGALNAASGYVDIGQADIRVTPAVATGLNNNPSPPELRPIHQEIVFAQRYWNQSYPYGVAAGTTSEPGAAQWRVPGGADSFAFAGMATFGAEMRAAPTMTLYSPRSGVSGKGSNGINGDFAARVVDGVAAGTRSVSFQANNDANGAAPGSSQNEVHWTANARL
jgi:hypothetical protein